MVGGRNRLGMISTHWSKTQQPPDRSFRLLVNARFREMLGMTDGDEIIGQAMLGGVVHPEDRTILRARIAQACDPRSDGRHQFEHRVVTPQGKRWLLTFGQVHFAGEGTDRRAVRVVGNNLDITERKRAEAALRENEEQLRQVLEIGTVGVVFFDLQDGITGANDAFLGMTGFTRAELEAGRVRYDDLTPPDWRWRDEQTIAELKAGGESGPFEKKGRLADLDLLHRQAALGWDRR